MAYRQHGEGLYCKGSKAADEVCNTVTLEQWRDGNSQRFLEEIEKRRVARKANRENIIIDEVADFFQTIDKATGKT